MTLKELLPLINETHVAIYEQIEELGGGFTYECKRNV